MSEVKIPVIINNRDLHTWPNRMIERIREYKGVGQIVIVDNGSTYQPTLDWYKTSPCKVSNHSNIGHAAPWVTGEVQSLNSQYYVVTDSDLGLDDTPDDTLLYLYDRLKTFNFDKIGLGLNWEYVKEDSPYFNFLQGYGKQYETVENGVHINVQTDTTFALYKTPNYFIGGVSSAFPYSARHYPWELTSKQYSDFEEYQYYIKNASNSCTYKSFLNL